MTPREWFLLIWGFAVFLMLMISIHRIQSLTRIIQQTKGIYRKLPTPRYMNIPELSEKNPQALKIAITELRDALGEWAAVSETYAPTWTHPIMSALSQLETALAAAEEKQE